MPVGTSGKGLLLLSGGIDSPVAGYMMAKRDVRKGTCIFTAILTRDCAQRKRLWNWLKKIADYTGEVFCRNNIRNRNSDPDT